MTFIYNQLKGVENDFAATIICADTQNLNRFPVEDIYPKRKGFLGRLYSSTNRLALNKFSSLSPRQYFYWRKILRQNEVRMIHAHFGPAGIEILPLAKSLNIPLLVTFHGYDASSFLRSSVYVKSLIQLFKYARGICVSRNMAEKLIGLGIPPTRVNTHYIGTSLENFKFVKRQTLREKSLQRKQINFLQVSNFVEKKGHQYTVEAFSRFVTYYPDANLCLAGDGPLRPEMEELVARLGLSSRILFTGAIDSNEVSRRMAQADAFLHHSVTAGNGDMEGIPTVLMEAMATGLPVVSTHHSGIPELIVHGYNGYLVNERDVDGYAAVLRSLLQIDSSIGEGARETVANNFNLAVQNSRLAEIYRGMIEDVK